MNGFLSSRYGSIVVIVVIIVNIIAIIITTVVIIVWISRGRWASMGDELLGSLFYLLV